MDCTGYLGELEMEFLWLDFGEALDIVTPQTITDRIRGTRILYVHVFSPVNVGNLLVPWIPWDGIFENG